MVAGQIPNCHNIFFPNFINSNAIITSNPSAASLRDEPSLNYRLLGEAIERYSCTFILEDELYTDSELTDKVSLKEVCFVQSKVWTKVVSLKTQNILPMQAEKVFSSLHQLYPSLYKPLSSSGVAAYKNLEKARYAALLELIEREALLMCWRTSDSKVGKITRALSSNITDSFPEVKWLRYLLSKKNEELQILAIENPLNLPIILAYSFSTEPNKLFKFGSRISLNWRDSIIKAINELLQGMPEIIQPLSNSNEMDAPRSFIERPKYWSQPTRRDVLLRRLSFDETWNELPPLPDFIWDELINELYNWVNSAVEVRITPPDILIAGWEVVRVIVTDFEPFVGSHEDEIPNIHQVNKFLKCINRNPVDSIVLDPFPFP